MLLLILPHFKKSQGPFPSLAVLEAGWPENSQLPGLQSKLLPSTIYLGKCPTRLMICKVDLLFNCLLWQLLKASPPPHYSPRCHCIHYRSLQVSSKSFNTDTIKSQSFSLSLLLLFFLCTSFLVLKSEQTDSVSISSLMIIVIVSVSFFQGRKTSSVVEGFPIPCQVNTCF